MVDFGVTFWARYLRALGGNKTANRLKSENEHGAEARRSLSRIEGVQNRTKSDLKSNFGHSVVEAQFGIAVWVQFGAFWGPKVEQFSNKNEVENRSKIWDEEMTKMGAQSKLAHSRRRNARGPSSLYFISID